MEIVLKKAIEQDDLARFSALRVMVDKAVEHAWENGEPGKSYEGAWEVTCGFPSTDEGGSTKGACYWQIVLHCYLLGPSRHYTWAGKTFKEALTKCEQNVIPWCRAEMEKEAL